jgi:transposase
MPRIPRRIQKEIITLRKQKVSICEVSKRLKTSEPTVKNYSKDITIKGQKNKGGRPKKLSQKI